MYLAQSVAPKPRLSDFASGSLEGAPKAGINRDFDPLFLAGLIFTPMNPFIRPFLAAKRIAPLITGDEAYLFSAVRHVPWIPSIMLTRHFQLSSWSRPTSDIPLDPGLLIGINSLAYEKNYMLGRISSPISPRVLITAQTGCSFCWARFACLMLGNIFSQMVVLRWYRGTKSVKKSQNESKLKNP